MATKMSTAQEAVGVLDALPDEIKNLDQSSDPREIAALVARAEEALDVLKRTYSLNTPASRRAPALNGRSH